MEHTPASRFVELLGRLGYKTQQQIAELLGVARPTAGTIVRKEVDPSFAAVAKFKEIHPEVNMEWIFSGTGKAILAKAAPVETEPDPAPATPVTEEEEIVLSADVNGDEYYHRYHALLDMVKTGFFGSPEQLLKGKKARASSGAASLYDMVDAIQAEHVAAQRIFVTGFQQEAVVRQLA